MKPSDYIRTAFKNLLRQKARTSLTILAIVIGAVSVTVMLSLVIAGKRAFMGSLESSGALKLVTVMPNTENDDNNTDLFRTSWNSDSKNKLDDNTIEKVKKVAHVTQYTPVLSPQIQGVKLEGAKKSYYTNVLGVDPTKDVFNVNLIAGRKLIPGDTNKIVVSDSVLKSFGYKGNVEDLLGKNVIFLTKGWNGVPLSEPDPQRPPQNMNGPMSQEDQKKWEEYQNNLREKTYEIPVQIVGITQSGFSGDLSLITLDYAKYLGKGKDWGVDQAAMDEFNKKMEEFEKENQLRQQQQNQASRNNQKFTPQQTKMPDRPSPPEQTIQIRDMFTNNGYGSIMLKVDETSNVETVAKSIESLNLKPVTAQNTIDEFSKMFTILGSILGGIGSISLFVATIGIINTMIMATYERTKEIGVLRACGAKRSTIRRLFTFESAMLGFFGGLTGLGISYLIATIGNMVLDNVSQEQSLPLEGLITFPLWLSLGVVAFTTVIGMLAGLYPAFRASRLDPIAALRYE